MVWCMIALILLSSETGGNVVFLKRSRNVLTHFVWGLRPATVLHCHWDIKILGRALSLFFLFQFIIKFVQYELTTFVLKNLCRIFDKYAVARTAHDALVKSIAKNFSNFVAISENANFKDPSIKDICTFFWFFNTHLPWVGRFFLLVLQIFKEIITPPLPNCKHILWMAL